MKTWFNAILRLGFCLGFCGPSLAQALPQPEPALPFAWRLFANGGYFNTTANYAFTGGSYTDLTYSRYYRLINGQAGLEYALSPEWHLLTDLGLGAAESFDGTFARNNTTLTEWTLAARYQVRTNTFEFVPEFRLMIPFNKVDADTDSVLTGEGALQAWLGLWAGVPVGQFRPLGFVAYAYRDGGRAGLLHYQLGMDWTPAPLRLGFAVYGFAVVSEDSETSNRFARDSVTVRVNGGSYKFYSVNPNELSLRGEIGADLGENWRASARYEQTINGSASAAGYTISGAVEWRLGTASESRERSSSRSLEVPIEEAPETFVPAKPDYDPTLFEDPKPKPKPKKPKTKKRPKPMDVDRALEDVQKSLEP